MMIHGIIIIMGVIIQSEIIYILILYSDAHQKFCLYFTFLFELPLLNSITLDWYSDSLMLEFIQKYEDYKIWSIKSHGNTEKYHSGLKFWTSIKWKCKILKTIIVEILVASIAIIRMGLLPKLWHSKIWNKTWSKK